MNNAEQNIMKGKDALDSSFKKDKFKNSKDKTESRKLNI